jgi:hypothetical protein
VTATFIWLMIALKIPIAALLYLVHWAIKQTPESAEDQGGGTLRPTGPHPRDRRPRPPRRGPHGAAGGPIASPPRVRSVTARGRSMSGH